MAGGVTLHRLKKHCSPPPPRHSAQFSFLPLSRSAICRSIPSSTGYQPNTVVERRLRPDHKLHWATQASFSHTMAGLLLLVCFGLLMLGLVTAGRDGPLLQGRSIAECDSNCGQSNPIPTASNAYLTRHCLLGTWCCPPAYRCGYVDMAGGWSCFENTSYSQSASTEAPSTVSIEIPTTATAHNVASTVSFHFPFVYKTANWCNTVATTFGRTCLNSSLVGDS